VAESIRDLLFGGPMARGLVETITPQRTFADVVLPPDTIAALEYALQVIRKHDLLFREWGLGERHATGLGLAFHFAGPPGTGKTICAEALAHALGRELLVVRYSELESRWAGQTGKHVATVFRSAERQGAVLFFDEADAIAGRRFTMATVGTSGCHLLWPGTAWSAIDLDWSTLNTTSGIGILLSFVPPTPQLPLEGHTDRPRL